MKRILYSAMIISLFIFNNCKAQVEQLIVYNNNVNFTAEITMYAQCPSAGDYTGCDIISNVIGLANYPNTTYTYTYSDCCYFQSSGPGWYSIANPLTSCPGTAPY